MDLTKINGFFTMADLFFSDYKCENLKQIVIKNGWKNPEKFLVKLKMAKLKTIIIYLFILIKILFQKIFWSFCMYFNIYFLIFLCTLFTHMLLKNERMHFLYIDLSQCTFCQRFRWFVKWPAICCPLFFGNFFVSFYMSRFLFSWTLFLIFFL